MTQTVLSKPGSIGVSFAGVTDEYKIVANILMFADRLLNLTTKVSDVTYALEKHGLEPTPENIAKVQSFFSAEHDWSEAD